MSEQKYPHKRYLKNYLVYPKSQLKIVGLSVLWLVGITVVFQIISYMRFAKVTQLMVGFYGLPEHTRNTLIKLNKELLFEHLIHTSIYAAFVAFILIYLSHRVYGPIVNIKRYLRELIAGNYKEKIILRKRDEFKEVADLLNELRDKLKK